MFTDLYTSHPKFWKSVYGYNMDCIGKKWITQAPTMPISELLVATDSGNLAPLNTATDVK